MKKTLLFLLLTLTGLSVMASPVKPQKALLVAKNFMAQYVKGADQMEATVVYTHPMPKSGQPAMYAVNIGNMFVLVSADDIAHPVLGYSLSRPWPEQTLPSQVSSYLDDLAAQIETAAGQQENPDRETTEEWRQLLSNSNQLTTTNLPDSVGPLLTTTWDQGQYYNALCPEDANSPYDGHVPTGCVATAMAQIVNYWGYPVHGRGTHSYNVSGLDANSFYGDVNTTGYGTLYVDYDSITYDYYNMPNALSATSTTQEVAAVAQLMYHCGVSVNMLYGPSESGAMEEDVRSALISYYGFAPTLGYAQRQVYTENAWIDSLRANIDRGEPVFYCGSSAWAAHAFVLDGYKQDNYFHFNFGWSGYGDGWYLTSAIEPSWSFNDWQSAIMGIRPDSSAHSVICHRKMYVQNVDNFTVTEPMDLYPMRGGSMYQTTNEETGVRIDLNLLPDDSTGQLVLDVIDFGREQSVAIYDGINRDSLVRVIETRNLDDWNTVTYRTWFYGGQPSDTVFQNMAGTDFTPMISSRHGFTIVAYSYGGMPEEFHLRVRNADDTTNIPPSTTNIYWTDIVTSEPQGYLLDGDTIRIFTAEAFAWVSHCLDSMIVNDINFSMYYGHVISIENDIDLGGYIWKPIRMWEGNVEGNGHVIRNMQVASSRNGGLFSSIGSNKIANIGMVNARVNAVTEAGTIAGYITHCILENCYSINHIVSSGNSTPGGLIGIASQESKIGNCYAYGDLSAQFGYGGIVGQMYNSEMSNCVSHVGESFNWSTHNRWFGLLTEEVQGGTFSNCFSDISVTKRNWYSDDPEYLALARRAYFLGNVYDVDAMSNLATFNISIDTMGILITDTAVNYTLGDNMDVITALNNFVEEYNSPDFRIWVRDSITHLPVFGGYYEVTCPNVSNITAENIPYNGGFAVALSWQENGEAVEWQIKCKMINQPEDSAMVFSTTSTFDTVEGLQLGNDYYFYVRPICGGDDTVGWGQPIKFYVDKTLWIDVVTSQPDGYYNNGNGKVIVSTPEGLAWLAKIGFDYRQDTIIIANDLDMGAYKWTPIGRYDFNGVIEGNNHCISNLYVNENISDVNAIKIGLVGYARNASFSNVIINNSSFTGNYLVGSLFGLAENTTVSNCQAINVSVKGMYTVGGLGGGLWNGEGSSLTYNCYSSGAVYAHQDVGGLYGSWSGSLTNSYSHCDVHPLGTGNERYYQVDRGGLLGGALGSINNCYSAGIVSADHDDNVYGSFIGAYEYGEINYAYSQKLDGIQFVGRINGDGVLSDTSSIANGNLQTAVTIAGTTYTDLLSALNAWVDANDTAGIYRHWAADSANVNGGFPVFAAIPCTPATGSDSITVCDSYTWHGTVYTADTILTDTLSTMEGCDSIVTHYLTIKHSTTATETTTACESYFFGGQWLYASGQYVDTLTNAAGCDSIVTLTLTINNPIHTATTVTACDSYTWNGATITTSGDYTYPHNDDNGCTQVDTLHLTINYSTASSETATVCEAYFWNGEWRYSSGQYSDTLTNAAGCDSIATLNLTINNPVHTATTATACDSYTWQEAVITTSGTYHYTHTDANGCTQDDTLYLTINYSTIGDTTATACDSFTWWNTTYTNSTNTPTHIYTNAAGCDSTVTLHLTINHSTSSIVTDTACEAYFWNGEWQYTSGQYSDTTTNSVGCDSIAILNLTINNPVHTATTVTACDSYTWQEAVITTSGTYHYTHTDANGCTQDDTLYLTINHNDTVIVDEVVCDSLTWYGTTYTASAYGIQYLTVPNTVGCDSIFFLDLTVNYTTYGEMSAVSCDSYQWDWNSAIYTASGDYTYRDTVNQNSQFCDSVLTLHLTINHSATSDTTATACDLFVWYSNMGYDVSGDYEHQWWNVTTDGCDSILTLHLTINYSTETTVTDTAEGSYSWHGTTYTESGTYTWNGTTAEGCDSTVTLLLTITPTQAITQSSIQAIKIYPNPTSDLLTIDADDILSVELFDLNGRLVFSSEVDSSPFTFRLSPFTLNAGSYLLRIHTQQGTAVQHVILN